MAPAIMCFGRKPADPEFKKNDDIEKSLRMDRKRAEREVKLLLLGKSPVQSKHARVHSCMHTQDSV
jgi:hypothetical protein